MTKCPFCNLDKEEIVHTSKDVVTIKSKWESAPGHLLVVPKRHVSRLGSLQSQEYLNLFLMARRVIDNLEFDYTIGVNDGVLAGQTVSHTHLHLIPRYEGDVEDPRGGIRWAIPKTAKYWYPQTLHKVNEHPLDVSL